MYIYDPLAPKWQNMLVFHVHLFLITDLKLEMTLTKASVHCTVSVCRCFLFVCLFSVMKSCGIYLNDHVIRMSFKCI